MSRVIDVSTKKKNIDAMFCENVGHGAEYTSGRGWKCRPWRAQNGLRCKCSREIAKHVLVMTLSVSTFDINRTLKWTILKLKYIATDAGKMPSSSPSHMFCYTRAMARGSQQEHFRPPKEPQLPTREGLIDVENEWSASIFISFPMKNEHFV